MGRKVIGQQEIANLESDLIRSVLTDTGCLGLVHWDDPEGGRREEGSGWGTHVYLWWIHFNIWQN